MGEFGIGLEFTQENEASLFAGGTDIGVAPFFLGAVYGDGRGLFVNRRLASVAACKHVSTKLEFLLAHTV